MSRITWAEAVLGSSLSVIWSCSNASYAGMRAQAQPETKNWRRLTFVTGFPFTLASFAFVKKGSGRVYGIDISKN